MKILQIEFFRAKLEKGISVEPDCQMTIDDERDEMLSNIEFRAKNQEWTFCGNNFIVQSLCDEKVIELPMYF